MTSNGQAAQLYPFRGGKGEPRWQFTTNKCDDACFPVLKIISANARSIILEG